MRVLWLTPGASKYKNEKLGYYGGGWIESLQTILENCKEIDQLGIAFSHPTDSMKLKKEKISYYPIKRKRPTNKISKILSNWCKTENQEQIQALLPIIEDFHPDLIHIFGTESWFCHAVRMTKIPIVIHIQGLLLPYLNSYNPIGISDFDLIKFRWKDVITGGGLWHDKKILEKNAKREYLFFKNISYFMGRTNWDKSISGFLSPKSTYFHVDEVLRDAFYSATPWTYNKHKKKIITSTISDKVYKGLDLIIKTASLLVNEGFDFEWKIIGVENKSNTALLFGNSLNVKYKSLNINLLGIKTSDEIIELLSETTIYVHPSYIDNSPNSLCEAQLMGIPVIATNVGGVSSLIDNFKDGYLVPANDPYLLSSRIVQILNNEAELMEISKYARETAINRHSKENIVDQLIAVYRHLSNRK